MSAATTPTAATAATAATPTASGSEPPKKAPIVWSNQEEYLLSLWADRALCYKMLHEDAQHLYKRQHMWFSIPVIILSTLAGTANVAISSYVPAASMSTAQLVIGVVNLISGIISTLSNYFRAAEKCESHRNASVGWGKLHRSIFVELSLERDKRKPVIDFMRLSKNEYDRLTDNSPDVRASILAKFSERTAGNPLIILPEECGNLMHTSSWEHVGGHRMRVLEARGMLEDTQGPRNSIVGPWAPVQLPVQLPVQQLPAQLPAQPPVQLPAQLPVQLQSISEEIELRMPLQPNPLFDQALAQQPVKQMPVPTKPPTVPTKPPTAASAPTKPPTATVSVLAPMPAPAYAIASLNVDIVDRFALAIETATTGAAAEPAVAEPALAEPALAEPATDGPIEAEFALADSATDEPALAEAAAAPAAAAEPAAEPEPAAEHVAADE